MEDEPGEMPRQESIEATISASSGGRVGLHDAGVIDED